MQNNKEMNVMPGTMEQRAARVCAPFVINHPVRWIALLGLCAAYIQGSVMKLFDFNGAIAEMEHFGLTPAAPIAAAVIFFELVCSAMVLSGFWRWIGALALAGFTLMATFIALRFWEMPPGMPRMMATNSFFEHLGLAGAFVLVAWYDLYRWKNGAKEDLS
ncbi:DoxX family protein [Shinella granuli]|uniref:Putative membrane protein YphA (DoxX/SURF4 family) n=2 Tax=Shinella granuli TaxID=323621 RepID=A0A4R2CDV4_SHIGR|nr:putative membrane protein YphA (DoxX/SURF4 family) [Shinella granuli]